jgi:8-oxo-dGTP pyrophosphatase MutT (NUDIX family)
MEYSGLEKNEEYEQRLKETYGEYTKIVDIRRNNYDNQGLCIYNEIKRNIGYVAGLLYTKEGNVYLSRRENRSKPYWKSYQSTGGDIENNEIPEQTCIRKIWEESGIQIGEEQIKYIGQYEENEIRRTCDLYMIKIGGFQKPKPMGVMRNTTWYEMTGKQMYERRLIPVYEHFKKEILEELGYKYED